jgi:3-hydroxyisobutyrate dehydrogenase-like beta-hydroxyacid dehydrogenase
MNSGNVKDAIASVGVIGLGVMGLPISVNIVKAGFEVCGYDILPQRIENLVTNGGKAGGSALEVAATAQLILTSLPSLAAFEDVVWGRQGILSSGAEGLIVMECSTLAVDDKQRAGEDMAKAGMALLDCPISGGSRAAQKDLVVYGSGDQGIYERCLPIVNAFARANYYLGEFGNGTKMKLVANLLVAIHNVSTAEAMVFGMKSGLDPETIFKVMSDSSGRSRMFEVRGPRMVEDNYQNPTMRVKTFRKDLEIIGKQATDINCPTPLFTSCVQVYLSALAQGLDEQDTASVCAVLEKWAHLKREQIP